MTTTTPPPPPPPPLPPKDVELLFWNMTPCSLVQMYRCVVGNSCLRI
jgi:hypothetical protein